MTKLAHFLLSDVFFSLFLWNAIFVRKWTQIITQKVAKFTVKQCVVPKIVLPMYYVINCNVLEGSVISFLLDQNIENQMSLSNFSTNLKSILVYHFIWFFRLLLHITITLQHFHLNIGSNLANTCKTAWGHGPRVHNTQNCCSRIYPLQ